MTSLIVGAATDVVLDNTGLSDLKEGATGNLNGRSVKHWSYYLFIAGSIVGAIAAIAGFIIWFVIPTVTVSLPIGIGGLVLGLTNGFAALYTKKFGQLKTMEQYTKQLEAYVKQFSGKIDDLEDVDEDLGAITDELGEVPKDWKAEIEKGEEALGEKIKELENVTKKLNATEQKVELLAHIVVDMGKQTEAFSKETLKFSEENTIIGDHVLKLEGHVAGLDRENEEIVQEIMDLDVQNDQTEKVLGEFAKQNELLQQNMKIRQQIYEASKVQIKKLESEVEELNKVIPKAVESADKVDYTAHELVALVQQLEARIAKYKGWKDDARNWRKFIATPAGEAYLEGLEDK